MRLYDFHGGIHPPEEKALANPGVVVDAGIPPRLRLPLNQMAAASSKACVQVGERVLGGQVIATPATEQGVPIHAPTSGQITAIDTFPVPHASGLNDLCIEITPDTDNLWVNCQPLHNWQSLDGAVLIDRIRDAGIAGLGGAGFPTATKLLAKDSHDIQTLLINGAECEPYISADDTLMQTSADSILDGADILAHAVGAQTIIFALEDNKPAAINAMRAALERRDERVDRQLVVIPTKYPSGGEKQLIEIITGQQVPAGGLPADLGIICQSPATASAVADAVIRGIPLTQRLVTVTGRTLGKPANFLALLGTPVSYLLQQADHQTQAATRLIHGGPMMGFELSSADAPIVKISNCILAPGANELPPPPAAQACIRCGLCAEVCPASLLPQQLYWYARTNDHEQLERHNLVDCIECGACAWVCPSHIPLVQYYRAGKAALANALEERERAERSQARFEARLERHEREAKERAEKRAQRKAAVQAQAQVQDPVAAAIARAKARKQSAQQPSRHDAAQSTDTQDATETDPVAAAIARSRARRAARNSAEGGKQGDNE